jgi:hypothetical protein
MRKGRKRYDISMGLTSWVAFWFGRMSLSGFASRWRLGRATVLGAMALAALGACPTSPFWPRRVSGRATRQTEISQQDSNLAIHRTRYTAALR